MRDPGAGAARPRRHDDSRTIRVGFTASRKVGGAVARNRARRKLKALARELLPGLGRPGYDYVLIARAATVRRPHAELSRDLRGALARIKKQTEARSAA